MKYTIAPITLSLLLGTLFANATAPNREGMTIKGTVTSQGLPLKGVVVSDGVEVTTTDADGNYWLPSQKANGWVFASIPSGYEAVCDRSFPQFYALTTAPADQVEEHNFTFTEADQSQFKLIALADMHLAHYQNDLEQFSSVFIPTVKKLVRDAADIPVYTINLGDMSFDMYWYSTGYAIEDYKKSIQVLGYPTPMFHIPGNHDNDGAVTATTAEETDFLSVQRYIKTIGPNYYSFNIGNIHFVMLDNIIYKNEPGGKKFEGIKGARNYDRRLTQQELDWLKKDLATVADKNAPIIVGMHASAYYYKGTEEHKVSPRYSSAADSKALSDCFAEFKNVHFISGHTHYNNTMYVSSNIIEHNLCSLRGASWYPGSIGNTNLCPNGAPSGFDIFNINEGEIIDWKYVGTVTGDYQFRACDMNVVREFYRNNPDMQKFIAHYPKRDLSDVPDNQVYLNVFDWAPDWTISVKENGVELPVTHEILEDPFYTISFHMPITTSRDSYPSNYAKATVNHMFKIQANTATAPLDITVTDHFGRVYTEHMERPKAFSTSMK